jgi:fructose-1,6-bisphosphatase/inositol monophosphatase family enzyme
LKISKINRKTEFSTPLFIKDVSNLSRNSSGSAFLLRTFRGIRRFFSAASALVSVAASSGTRVGNFG